MSQKKTLKSLVVGLVIQLIRLVARGLARWFVLLGEHPGLSRDAGFLAWRHLQRVGRPDEPGAGPPDGPKAALKDGPQDGPKDGPKDGLPASPRTPSQLPPSVRRALRRRRRLSAGLGSPFLGL